MPDIVKVIGPDHVATVSSLAEKIWRQHYPAIIGDAQVEYMLKEFQSDKAISAQISEGAMYYLLRDDKRAWIGYAAVIPRGGTLFLSKFYILKEARGSGHGRKFVEFIEDVARNKKLGKITLTVNKSNTDAISIYRRLGFEIKGPVTVDIGGGFVMDDHTMEKDIVNLRG